MPMKLISGVLNENLLGVREPAGAGRSSVWGEGVPPAPCAAPCDADLEKILENCFPSLEKNRHHFIDDDVCNEEHCNDDGVDYFGLDGESCPLYDSEVVGRVDEMVGRVDEKISTGEFFDISSFLSWMPSGAPTRNFLITRDGSEVDVNTLKGKYVVVCCVFLPLHNEFQQNDVANLWSICAAAAVCPFQLVIVPKLRPGFDSHLVIKHSFSAFPSTCLFIPYECSISCDFVCNSLGLSGYIRSLATLIVDPNGTVLQTSVQCFVEYGTNAFPFTDEHIRSLDDNTHQLRCRLDGFEDYLRKKKFTPCHAPSLDELLLCDPSHRLPLATDEEVSISVSDLNAGYVGLYLCRYGFMVDLLSQLHHQCTDKGLQFDILIIPLNFLDPPSSIWDRIRLSLRKYNVSSWWLFPYNDRVCRHLWRLAFGYPFEQLIVLPPRGSTLSGELKGDALFTCFGVGAHPFTKVSIVERQLKRLRELTLTDVFPKDCTVYGCNRHPLDVHRLQSKNVFIYLDLNYPPCSELLSYLYEIHDAHPHSVLIYVPPKSCENHIEFDHPPWRVSRTRLNDVYSILFSNARAENLDDGTIIAVKHGRILSTKAQFHLNDKGAFPFHNYLREDVVSDLLSSLQCIDDDD